MKKTFSSLFYLTTLSTIFINNSRKLTAVRLDTKMLMNDFPSFNLFVLSLVFNTVNLSTAMENFTKNHKVIEKF